MRNRALFPVAVLATALVLAACAAGPAATPSTTEIVIADPSPTEEAPTPGMAFADITDEGIALLVARAADEARVTIDEVRVVTAEEVTWSDGSLGCPQPGMGYTQALVPGFRVVLEIDGEELNFHAAQGGEFRFCEDPQRPVDGR